MSTDAERIQDEIFRRMTPSQRVDCALRWTAFTLEFARAGVRSLYPDWTPEQVEREVGRRITGIDVTKLDWTKIERQRPGAGASAARELSPDRERHVGFHPEDADRDDPR